MKCGCAKTDAFECGEDLKRCGLLDSVTKNPWDSFQTTIVRWKCDCVCHDEAARNRLKLAPVKNTGNTSSGNPS